MTIRVLESLEGDKYASIDDLLEWAGANEKIPTMLSENDFIYLLEELKARS